MQYPVSQNLLTIALNRQFGIYWPSQNINSIGIWNTQSAYKLKVLGESVITFKGNIIETSSLSFGAGAHYLPVLTNTETFIIDAIENPAENVRIIYDTYSGSVYWPEGHIYSLTSFEPGVGYLANFKNPVTVTFNDYNMNPDDKGFAAPKAPEKAPWPVIRTGDIHLVSVFEEATKSLENYSHIGAFDNEGVCIGYANITSKAQNNLLTIFGNDAHTSFKDGAEDGELISFRAYDPATGQETELTASYNQSFPNHDGLFASGGLSAIISFKEGATGIGESNQLSQIRVYPNPAKEELNLVIENSAINLDTRIEMVNSAGSMVLQKDILQKHTKLDVSKLHPGVYVLKIIQNGNITFRKVVVQ